MNIDIKKSKLPTGLQAKWLIIIGLFSQLLPILGKLLPKDKKERKKLCNCVTVASILDGTEYNSCNAYPPDRYKES